MSTFIVPVVTTLILAPIGAVLSNAAVERYRQWRENRAKQPVIWL